MRHTLYRAHEHPIAMRAGMLSLAVHGVLLLVMLLSFSLNTPQPLAISDVELWDSLPSQALPAKVKALPPEPKPEPKPEPEPEPIIKETPKPEPEPEPAAEIQLKKEKPVEKKPIQKEQEKKQEKPKVEEKKVDDRAEKAKAEEKKRKDELKKLQDMLAEEDASDAEQASANAAKEAANKAAAAANAGEVNKYKALISNKIKSRVNKQLCGDGKPKLTFSINLLPTGELSGSPKMVKGTGIDACDQAVERAIIESQPLPLPENKDLFSQFRNLKLDFSPNED
jgi:colicin import membrane protein